MKRIVIIVGVAVLVAALGAWLWWRSAPHSASEQYDRACKADAELAARAGTLTPEELVAERERLVAEFEKVCTEFENDGTHDDARQRVAEICEELLGDRVRAAEAYEQLLAEHPDSDLAEEAVQRLARLYRELGVAESNREKSLEWFTKAVDLLKKFLADHAGSPWAEEATIEIARLWQDHIREPPIRAKEALGEPDGYLGRYPQGKHAAEARFRLGQWYESVKEEQAAVGEYTRVTKEYPESEYADRALERLEEIYAEKLQDKEKAAEAARRLAERHRGTARGARYATRARDHEADKVRDEDRQYEGEYYGGSPADVTVDKPFPHEMYADLIAQKIDVRSYVLDVTIQPESGELTVAGRLTMTNGGDAKDGFLLMLNGAMSLEDVRLGGAPVEVASPSGPGREVVGLRLSSPWPAGAEGTLEFKARGKFEPPVAVPEGVDLESGAAPSPEAEEAIRASMSGDPRLRIGPTGYAISGAAWYPLSVYGDVFTTDVTYHLPEGGYEVVSTGRVSSGESGGGTVRRWVCDVPIMGLYFAYGKYVAVEGQWTGGRTVAAYVPEDRRELGGELVRAAGGILEFYESRFGRLKQPRMSIVVCTLPAFLGGIGPPGMMMLAEHAVGEKGPPVSLMAHELSHQWWGNVVPVSFERGYSLWLSEGFATYSDALYNEHLHGREFLVRHLRKYGVLYFEGETHVPGAATAVAPCMPDNPLYRMTVYEKGALALHALRYVLGDEAFFAVLRRYAAELENRHSTIEDVRGIAEAVAGEDLRWFFDEWLRRKGFPHYAISDLEVGGDADGPYAAVIIQELRGADAPWRTPLDVAFHGPGGRGHVVRKAKVDERENRVSVRLPWRPERVEIDPDHWVFRHPGSDNVWPHAEPAPAGQGGAPPADSGEAETQPVM